MSFPDYRKAAEDRMHRALGIVAVCIGGVCIGMVAGVIAIVWHFTTKFW